MCYDQTNTQIGLSPKSSPLNISVLLRTSLGLLKTLKKIFPITSRDISCIFQREIEDSKGFHRIVDLRYTTPRWR